MKTLSNALWYWFYELLRYSIASTGRHYCRHIAIVHKDKVPQEGPVFLAANHPNALNDPLLTACHSERQVYFLTRGDIFATPFLDWLFRGLKMLPMYRQKDGGNTVERNAPTFAASVDILRHGGCALIFPEATMSKRRSIRPFKTGAARIVLEAQYLLGSTQKVSIVPVGLTYRAPNQIGTDLVLQYGDPIYCDDLLPEYARDQESAFTLFSQRLEEAVKALSLHIPEGERYEERVNCYEILVNAALPDPKNSDELYARWKTEKAFLEKLNTGAYDEETHALFEEIKAWRQEAASLGVPEEVIYQDAPSKGWLVAERALLLASAPAAFVCGLSSQVSYSAYKYFKKKVRDVDFHPSVAFFCSWVISPASYLLQSLLVSWFGGGLIGLAYLCLCPVMFELWILHKRRSARLSLLQKLSQIKAQNQEAFSSFREKLATLAGRCRALLER